MRIDILSRSIFTNSIISFAPRSNLSKAANSQIDLI